MKIRKQLLIYLHRGIKKLDDLNKSYGKKATFWRVLKFGLFTPYRCLIGLDLRLRDKLKLPYRLKMSQIEIELTTYCNLRCLNCDRSCRQVASTEQMSIKQIEKFIKESIVTKKKWKQIRILGGEPTLHPDIVNICNLFIEYKRKHSSKTRILLFTNGYGPRVNNILETIPVGIEIRNSNKDSPIQQFSSYNVSPIDLNNFQENTIDFSKGCVIIESCGLGLTRYGYYPCGAGGSTDRIFGMDIGIKELSEVSEPLLREQLSLLCKYCGHYKDWGREKNSTIVTEEVMSKSWRDAYSNYVKNEPELTLY